MSKVVVFSAGIVTGILSVPVGLVYIKPFQRALVRVGISIYTFALKQEGSDMREKIVAIRDKANQFLEDYPETK